MMANMNIPILIFSLRNKFLVEHFTIEMLYDLQWYTWYV